MNASIHALQPAEKLVPDAEDCSPFRCGISLDTDDDAPAKKNGGFDFGLSKTEDERKEVYSLRYRAFVENLTHPEDFAADHEHKLWYDDLDESACHFTVHNEDNLVGALRVHRFKSTQTKAPLPHDVRDQYKLDPFIEASPDGVAFLSRLIVDPEFRHGSVLNRLLQKTFEAGLKNDIDFAFVNCRPALVELYERMGYRRYADNIIDPEFGFRVPMVLVLRDLEYLKSVNSPYSRVLEKNPGGPFPHPSVVWFNRTYRSAIAQSAARRDRDSTFWKTLLAKLQSNAMGKTSILHGLSQGDIQKLTREGTILKARAGEALIRENDDDGTIFMIMSGTAKAHLNGRDDIVAEFGPGDTFGEIAMVTEAPRSNNVTLSKNSEVFVFTHDHLFRLIKTAPELAAKVLLNISKILGSRLAATTHNCRAA